MKTIRPASPALTGMLPYDPKYLPADTLMSANESPLDIPEELHDSISERVGKLAFDRYPDPLATKLREAIARHWGVKPANVLCGNGGDELLYDTFIAWGGPGRKLLTFPPTFSVYETDAVLTGTTVVNLPREGDDFHIDVDKAVAVLSEGDVDVVVLTSPNNPTGMGVATEDIERILDASDALVVVDEAYGEFMGRTCLPLLEGHGNLVILHTFSKAYRCAGARLGYILASPDVLAEYKKVRQPYSVDALSQVVGEEVMAHADLFQEAIEETKRERELLVERLSAMPGVVVHPSESNFVLFHVPYATRVWKGLYERHSVLVRDVSGDPRLPGCLRVTVGTPEENERFLSSLREVLAEERQGAA